MSDHFLYHCPVCRKLRAPMTLCPQCKSWVRREPLDFLVGRSIGPYHVEGLLGIGAIGVVYRVRPALDAPAVALKLMFPDADDESAEPRFLREAQMLRELRHPNIVRAEDVATSEWGPPYYTMEALEGHNLREVLRGLPRGMPLPEALEHARQIGSGLQHAHAAGLIHRDVKPENIFVVPAAGGFVDKLLDFGFAKWVAGRRRLRLTADGDIVGTPAYLTPEQVGLAPPGPRTDQYALALVVAELLTGRKMRQGMEPVEIATREVQHPLPAERLAAAAPPDHVVRALIRATRPKPEERFPDIGAFVAALEGRPAREARRPARRRTALFAALLALLAAAATVGLWLGPCR
jgi:eukaryotic-like serine/threonine-protein kinase